MRVALQQRSTWTMAQIWMFFLLCSHPCLINAFLPSAPCYRPFTKSFSVFKAQQGPFSRCHPNHHDRHISSLYSSSMMSSDAEAASYESTTLFNLTTALFCAGLAFDAYSEPSNSSRWEKGVSQSIFMVISCCI